MPYILAWEAARPTLRFVTRVPLSRVPSAELGLAFWRRGWGPEEADQPQYTNLSCQCQSIRITHPRVSLSTVSCIWARMVMSSKKKARLGDGRPLL